MDWIFENLQIVLVLAVVVGTLVKRVLETVKPPSSGERQAPPDVEMDEEENGPFSEWLPSRLPTETRTVPPPFLRPVTMTVSQSGPSAREAAILKQQQDMEEQLRKIRQSSKVNITGGAVATRSRVSASQHHKSPVASHATSDLRASLRQRKELRRAILLREILGPPVSLR